MVPEFHINGIGNLPDRHDHDANQSENRAAEGRNQRVPRRDRADAVNRSCEGVSPYDIRYFGFQEEKAKADASNFYPDQKRHADWTGETQSPGRTTTGAEIADPKPGPHSLLRSSADEDGKEQA